MSIIKNGDVNFFGFSGNVNQEFYVSSYYALVNEYILFDLRNHLSLTNDANYKLIKYIIDFGDNIQTKYETTPDMLTTYKYSAPGVYFISYTAVYANGASYSYNIPTPITIKEKWDVYSQTGVRLNDEIVLNLPYTLDDIKIQPNEWGVADIFNTSVTRLQECLSYLNSKTQTINTYSPTVFFGWLGNYSGTATSNIAWATRTINSTYYEKPEISKSTGNTYFTDVIDSVESNYHLFILDNNNLRIFQNIAQPIELFFTATDPLSAFLSNPVSLDIAKDDKTLYILDQTQNYLYKLLFNIVDLDASKSTVNIEMFAGGFGNMEDNSKFNTPIQVIESNQNVYVLDYNNYCVKQFNKDLSWLYTYNVPQFYDDRPISIAALSNGLLYVLTENYNIYIFDNLSNQIFESFSVSHANDESELKKICFSSNEDFLFILTEQNVYKYSLTGSFVSLFNTRKDKTILYNNIKAGPDCSLLITSNNVIFKHQDVLDVFKLGGGLPYNYWADDQLIVNKNEFPTDLVYNRCLIRLSQNIKSFRDTLNAKFIIANENSQSNIVTYFSYLPINLAVDKLYFDADIENETIGVGANELHVPPVINKELEKIYMALIQLADYLSIHDYNVTNDQCIDSFCWSWDAMSCYKLSLPVIRTCQINPISYNELALSGSILNYAPSAGPSWKQAISKCCK